MLSVALLLVLICPPMLAHSDNVTDDYMLQEKLEKALVDNPGNLYDIVEVFSSDYLIKCIPVMYVITESNDTQPVNCTNCTYGYSETFLWTSFNTTNLTGGLLFGWTKSGLWVFGFSDWARSCKFNATRDGIVLHLNVDTLPNIPDLQNVMTHILELITQELKAYAYANGEVPSPDIIEKNLGYAQKWSEDDIHKIPQGEALVIAAEVLLAVFSLLVMIAIVPTIYNKLHDKAQSRKNYFYLYFWSVVPLLYGLTIFALIYGIFQSYGRFTPIFILIYAICISAIVATVSSYVIPVYYKNKTIPCPLSSCSKCGLSDDCQRLNNCCAIFMSYSILVYLMYAIPTIIIAYYIFPSRTLVRLSFMQLALLISVLYFALLLYLLERMCILCLLRCSHTLVPDLEAATQELINLVQAEKSSTADSMSEQSRHTRSGTMLTEPLLPPGVDHLSQHGAPTNNSSQTHVPDPEAVTQELVQIENTSSTQTGQGDHPNVPITKTLIAWSVFKVVVALVGVPILTFLLVILGWIVFIQSAEDDPQIDQFLTIVPTVLVNVVIWALRNRLLHLQKSLGKTLTGTGTPSRDTQYGSTDDV